MKPPWVTALKRETSLSLSLSFPQFLSSCQNLLTRRIDDRYPLRGSALCSRTPGLLGGAWCEYEFRKLVPNYRLLLVCSKTIIV